jgi:hypothetical protein
MFNEIHPTIKHTLFRIKENLWDYYQFFPLPTTENFKLLSCIQLHNRIPYMDPSLSINPFLSTLCHNDQRVVVGMRIGHTRGDGP